MSPIVTSPSVTWNPRVEKGILNSANQPSSFCEVATSQCEFQSVPIGIPLVNSASLDMVRSCRTPAGLVTNQTAVS